ncbi:MAG TPA: hypothetical protein VGH03_19910 [Caulobacteraceae bacterium]|jgi:hypothetical protein
MPADATLAEATDPAVLRAERRLQLLEELTDIGMNLARALERQVLAAANPAKPAAPDAAEASTGRATTPNSPAPDPSVAFARISRAIRLTLALEARTDEALRALRAGVASECEVRRDQARRRAMADAVERNKDRRETVERLVIEAAEREIEDDEALCGVFEALEERLDDDAVYFHLDRLPLRETVEQLCADLELTPDWSRWEGEGWTPQPPFSRPKGSIWARPSRKPLRSLNESSIPAEASPGAGARRQE